MNDFPASAPIPLRFKPTREPRVHQWRSLELAKGRRAFAYFHEMGAGKSKIAVDEMIELWLAGQIDRAMFVAGAGSYGDWLSKHLPENTPDDVEILAHQWMGGSSKGEQRALNLIMRSQGALPILVMNVEALGSSQRAEGVAHNFVSGGRTLFVVDESTTVKDIGANRTGVAVALGRQARFVRIMTGSAVTKNPLDLWGQLCVMGVEESFASNYYSFRARFCITKKLHVKVPPRPGERPPPPGQPAKTRTVLKITNYQNLDKLADLLRRHSHRVLKEECLDLPPKTYQEYSVPLTEEQQRMYRQMSQIATTEIEEGTWSTAKNAMGRLAKLHQILLGHITDESGEVHGIETRRPAALCDLVEEAGDKVIVWCAYRRDVTLILEALAKKFPERKSVRYDGLTGVEERTAAVKSFQHGDAHCFVGTAATGGKGITLTASATTIYYSNNFKLEDRVQSEDRSHRDGQIRPVNIVDMICRGTVEEHIVRILREKKTLSDTVMGDGVRAWLSWL